MPVYLQHEEPPQPTHDEQRNVSRADEVRFDYDLHSRRGHQPGIKSSYGDTVLGTAQEERTDLVQPGKANIIARSGNQHWDEDSDENEGFAGIGAPPAPEVRGEDPSRPYVLAIAVAAGIYLAWKLFSERHGR